MRSHTLTPWPVSLSAEFYRVVSYSSIPRFLRLVQIENWSNQHSYGNFLWTRANNWSCRKTEKECKTFRFVFTNIRLCEFLTAVAKRPFVFRSSRNGFTHIRFCLRVFFVNWRIPKHATATAQKMRISSLSWSILTGSAWMLYDFVYDWAIWWNTNNNLLFTNVMNQHEDLTYSELNTQHIWAVLLTDHTFQNQKLDWRVSRTNSAIVSMAIFVPVMPLVLNMSCWHNDSYTVMYRMKSQETFSHIKSMISILILLPILCSFERQRSSYYQTNDLQNTPSDADT